MKDVQESEEPTTRLARIADQMTDLAGGHAEATADDRWLVLGNDGEVGTVHSANYEGKEEILAALLTHVEAMFNANGIEIAIVPGARVGGGLN